MSEKELSNIDIALFALYRLGGAERTIDTEDVAIECWRLAPEKFSWKKYPEYPESEPARSALFDAAKPKYGRLVRGRKKRTGWMLTVNGVDYLRTKQAVMQALFSGTKKVVSQHRELDQYFASVEKQVAFKKFQQLKTCESIEDHEFTELLRCSLDASPSVLRDRIEKVKTRAREANRNDVLSFLTACEQRFVNMLSD